MTKVRFFVTLITALLVVTSFSFAHDGEEHHVKIKLGGLGESVELGDLEVGETRQLYTDSGKEIVVTREEHGYKLSVDGKDIDIVSPGHHGASIVTLGDHEGEGKFEVVMKNIVHSGEHEEGENVFFFSGDDEGEAKRVFIAAGGDEGEHGEHGYVWVQGDEDAAKHHGVSYFVKKKDVLSQVLESNVLDELDEATRQKIIDVIKEAEKPEMRSFEGMHTIVIDTKDDEDGDE